MNISLYEVYRELRSQGTPQHQLREAMEKATNPALADSVARLKELDETWSDSPTWKRRYVKAMNDLEKAWFSTNDKPTWHDMANLWVAVSQVYRRMTCYHERYA